MVDIKKCCCNCVYCEPDDVDPETLDILFWCTRHCSETFSNSTCSYFLEFKYE